MKGKFLLGGLLAVGLMALSTQTASAQWYGGHPGHQRGGYGGGTVIVQRPVVVGPSYGYGYGAPIYNSPVFIQPRPVFVNPGYGYGGGFGGYGGGYGGGYNRGYGYNSGFVNVGVSRPGFGVSFGFPIR